MRFKLPIADLSAYGSTTPSALPRGPSAPHFAGHFVVLKQTARKAFQRDLPETACCAHTDDVCNDRQRKTYHTATPKIDSLESYFLGNWDESSALDTAEPGTDQPPVLPD